MHLNNKINIYICLHKQFPTITCNLFNPIQLGASINKKDLKILRDDTGDNISNLNPYFCELTAIYWAWKNSNSDYYGFFHYRRYLSFKFTHNRSIFLDSFDDKKMSFLFGLNENCIRKYLKNMDIVLPRKLQFNTSLYNQYCEFHKERDLFELRKIISMQCSEYLPYFDKAMHENSGYFYNIFIMNHFYFHKYCNWIFPILFEFQKKVKYNTTDFYEKRTPGFIAERLLSVFILYIKNSNKNIKIRELPTIIINLDNKPNNMVKTLTRCILIHFFPENTFRGKIARKIWNRLLRLKRRQVY